MGGSEKKYIYLSSTVKGFSHLYFNRDGDWGTEENNTDAEEDAEEDEADAEEDVADADAVEVILKNDRFVEAPSAVAHITLSPILSSR